MTKYKVDGDLYDISNRIRQIDRSYYIVRDKKLNRFEIHSDNQKGSSLCVVVPYDKLDMRTLVLASKTRVERTKQLMIEAEKHNQELIRQENKKLKENANERFDIALTRSAKTK